MRRALVALTLVVPLAACHTLGSSGQGPVADAAAIVAAADWDQAETLRVTLDEHSYSPRELRLKAGRPYRIELRNIGDKHHYFTAPEFFQSVAWRKLLVERQAEIKVDYITAVEVLRKGGRIDLFLVPVRKGSYRVVCTLDDHLEQGMEGLIVVE